MEKRIKKIFDKLGPRSRFFNSLNPSSKVLDVGCGVGYNGIALRSVHPETEFYGIDILPKEKIPDFYSYTITDLEEGMLPYPDNFFDAIILSHVLEHLHSTLKLGKEFNRVMKRGARIYIETPNWTTVFVPSFGFHREQLIPFNFYDDYTHIRPCSKQSLYEYLVQACGLQVEKVGTVRSWIRVPFDFFIILAGFFAGKRSYFISSFWNLYGWCIYAVGVKK